ncbi:MAG TPA: hypothetical protein VFK41_06950 [Nocardioidaceae bacterium]|nr:hypothetical protein [Nocardioidaceae bacterium]
MTPLDPADFRARLEAALADEPAGSFAADDLAAGKRLLRRRRSTWGAALATLAVVVGLPTVFWAAGVEPGNGDSSPRPVTTPAPQPDPPPHGWRWESYRDATFQVPDSWGYASSTGWCLHPEPAVRRPAGATRSIACPGGPGYGVQFYSAALYDAGNAAGTLVGVDGARPGWFGHAVAGATVVQVFAESQAVAQQVLDSVRRIEGQDANGCTPTADTQAHHDDPPVLDTMEFVKSLSICRYDLAPDSSDRAGLVQSELLTGVDASRALEALRAAPTADPVKLACTKPPSGETVRLLLDGQAVLVNWADNCQPIGVLDGKTVRALTADVMHWVLSPGWSGAFPVAQVADHDLFTLRSLNGSSTQGDNWEQVTHHGVRFDVPPKWERQAPDDWCIQAGRPEASIPRVSLPGMSSRDILCTPRHAYGVSVGSSAAVSLKYPSGHVWQYGNEGFYPEGAWLSIVYNDTWLVTIRTPDRHLTELIAASVELTP